MRDFAHNIALSACLQRYNGLSKLDHSVVRPLGGQHLDILTLNHWGETQQ